MRSDGTSSADGFAFAGYASLFNVADLSGDTVLMGAFHRSLQARGVAGIRMLWNHDPAEPIGVWTAIHEDSRGLRVEGRLTTAAYRARSLAALIKDGALDGLSIGFHTLRANRPKPATKAGPARRLIEVDLWEVSLVAFPMQPGARVDRINTGEPAPPQTFALPNPPAHSPTLQA
jgi:hypothetical protein